MEVESIRVRNSRVGNIRLKDIRAGDIRMEFIEVILPGREGIRVDIYTSNKLYRILAFRREIITGTQLT